MNIFRKVKNVIELNREALLKEKDSDCDKVFDEVIEQILEINLAVPALFGYGEGTIGLVYDLMLNDDLTDRQKAKMFYDVVEKVC